jgi:recombination DNA repair RAD52 pathway protein
MNMEQVTTARQPLTVNQLQALHSRLNKNRVASRRSGNQNLSYLEAWDVKATLIKVFGYGGFSAECLEARIIRDEQIPQANSDRLNWVVSAQATVRITIPQLGAVYTESAIGTNAQPQWGEAADTALKTAESDALKRAAIYLGTQFGLSLYDEGSTNNVISTVMAPDQHDIVTDLNSARTGSAESEAATARLQARMKVHQTTAPVSTTEPTVSQPPAVPTTPVATITAPGAAVAKARENAQRVGAQLDAAQAQAEAPKRKPVTRKKAPTQQTKLEQARQVLAAAEAAAGHRPTGTTPPARDDEPYLANYGGPVPDEFTADDDRQAREDAGL